MEGELRWAAARLISDFGLTGELTEQVIEGKPDDSFTGRLSIVVTGQNDEAAYVTELKAQFAEARRQWVEAGQS